MSELNELHELNEGEYEVSSRSQFGTAMAFFLIGASAGAITALLLTPKNGRQMRRSLARGYEDVKDSLGDWKSDLSDFADDRVGNVRERATSFAKDAKDAVSTARSTINDRLEALRH